MHNADIAYARGIRSQFGEKNRSRSRFSIKEGKRTTRTRHWSRRETVHVFRTIPIVARKPKGLQEFSRDEVFIRR